MSRHQLSRTRHGRHALAQPVARHAVIERPRGAAGPAPVRRGLAVVAVVGGALAAVGVPAVALAPPAEPEGGASAIGLAGLAAGLLTGTDTPAEQPDGNGAATRSATDSPPRPTTNPTSPATDSAKPVSGSATDSASSATDSAKPASDSAKPATADDPARPAVLDTDAVAEAVRSASEEGRRLTDKEKRSPATPTGRAAPTDQAAAGRAPAAAPADDAPAPGTRKARQFPGELIDTNDWYLTLPTGAEGRPDTVDGSALATFHNEFFTLDPARTGIAFSAGAGGATTKNSHYPRSELREMNGDAKASWSNTSGRHILDVREAFTKLPRTKPEVVGVQIHDGKDDVLQVRLEGKTLSVQSDDGRSQTVLDPDYRLGTPFDLRIVAADGKVDVFYDGAKKAALPLQGSGWYFKVGAYVQSNTEKGDGPGSTGEVVVSRATVTHQQ